VRSDIMASRTKQFVTPRRNAMKKLMSLMLGLSLALGCVAVSFAADEKPKAEKKKGKKKKAEEKK
jgi:hypothetical protein